MDVHAREREATKREREIYLKLKDPHRCLTRSARDPRTRMNRGAGRTVEVKGRGKVDKGVGSFFRSILFDMGQRF